LILSSAQLKDLCFLELNPRVYQIARPALLPWNIVRGFSVAFSNQSVIAALSVAVDGSTNGTLESPAQTTNSPLTLLNVEMIQGEAFVDKHVIPPPTIINIDTEGHEVSVIQSLSKTIDKHRPRIFFENLSLTDDQIVTHISHNYTLFTISDETDEMVLGLSRQMD
jgi:FkbM family methyltransferase